MGFILYFFTFSSDANSNAAAPSFNFDAFAAVMVPFFSNAGFINGIFSNFALPGSSSLIIMPSSLTQIISLEKSPSLIAF